MCTISVLRNQEGSILLTANRDELRVRGELGLMQNKQDDVKRIYPVDAQANGTWLGVNNYGVAASILNFYEVKYQGTLSRGLIIPHLLEFKHLADARRWLTQTFEPDLYSSFVLLLMSRENIYRYRWDGKSLQEETLNFTENYFHKSSNSVPSKHNFSSGFLEVSSSVDLQNTLAHRHQLFQQWQEQGGDEKSILNFHLTRDGNNSSPSVCMAREISHTKSISQIYLGPDGGQFRYLAPEKLVTMINATPEVDAMEIIKFDLLELDDTPCFSSGMGAVEILVGN